MSGYLGSNVSRNVQIPHGVRLMFQRTGGSWLNLGDLSEVSVTPVAEFLEQFSTHDGKNALAKRLLTNRGITIECTLNEINGDNLQLAFQGGATTSSVTKQIAVTDVVSGSGALGNVVYQLSDTPVGVSSITASSEDGDTTYDAADFTLAGSEVTAVPSRAMDAPGLTVHFSYLTSVTGMTQFEVLGDTSISGKVQFQIRNMEGGLAQVLELDSVTIAPSGAISTPIDAIQTLPLTVTAQVSNGSFGNFYTKNI